MIQHKVCCIKHPAKSNVRLYCLTIKLTQMYQTITTIPDFRVYEYLLVLNPTGEICQQIWNIKKGFEEKCNAPLASRTKPHITLINFLAYGRIEEKIISRFKMIAMGITPFEIELRNFASFYSHTIYLNVITKVPVENLAQELKQARYLLTLPKNAKPRFINIAHLTICRGLAPSQYELGWPEYSTRHFSGSFVADSMTLLKRAYGENSCRTVGQFTFQSTPVLLKQGSLFM